eukprot:CAMPEP_0184478932 /NCGR_PEP_ID=MMETSP0113_2-20130426/809_1 /TAXON_ID=91329 /ORGANISM="Norrisiella sphaerica, Strain BC52" /LENGTH=787 /DNA_ID=CAMNT_0026856871 /DNA_START=339 /DNA_END=2702 /DNA_ORIENTATION=+
MTPAIKTNGAPATSSSHDPQPWDARPVNYKVPKYSRSSSRRHSGATVQHAEAVNIPFPSYPDPHPVKPQRLSLSDEKLAQALPTNAWWENLVMDLDSPIVANPYSIKTRPEGIEICYPMRLAYVTNFSVTGGFNPDITFSLEDAPTSEPQVTDYDDLSVEVTYGLGNDTNMVLPLVRGAPLITVEVNNALPVLKWQVPIKSLEIPEGPTNKEQSVTYQVQLSNGQSWLVYARPAIQMEWTNTTFMRAYKQGGYTGTIRMGLLTCGFPSASWQKAFMPCNEDAFEVMLPFLHRYPVSGSANYRMIPGSADGDKAELSYSFETRGVGDYGYLVSLLPHHMMMIDKSLVKAYRKPAITINTWQSMMMHWTSRGPMTPIVANSQNENTTWTFSLDLPTLDFYNQVELPPDNTHDMIMKFLKSDIKTPMPISNDTYHLGKGLSRLARLALIAKQLGKNDEMKLCLKRIESHMTSWLKGDSDANRLVYDKTWGGLIVEKGVKGDNPIYDFGNGYYNDHHFHYGYMIYALAVWMHLDSDAAGSILDGKLSMYATALAKDIANGEKGEREFPVARHFDWFESHSWASGLFKMPDGREQESSSEAVNAYYAVSLLGSVLGNTQMRDYGRFLCAAEILGSQSYWHIPGIVLSTYFPLFSTGIYPSVFATNAMVGVIGGNMASHTTWFGTNVEYVHGIQMLPFTPATEYMLDHDYMQHEYGQMGMALARKKPALQPEWAGYIRMAEAIIDPKGAWDGARLTLNATAFDDGNSMTATMYWIATRPLDVTQDPKDIFSSN